MSVQSIFLRLAGAAALVAVPSLPPPQAADVRSATAAEAAIVSPRAPAPGDVTRMALRLAFPAAAAPVRPPVRRTLAVAPAGEVMERR